MARRTVYKPNNVEKKVDKYQNILHTLKDEFLKRWHNNLKSDTVSMDDFDCLQTLGVGGYGKVILVKHKQTGKYHAVKILSKEKLVERSQISKARDEMRVLQSVRFPFLIHMDYYFKNNSYLYFVMPFASGGDMFALLQEKGKFHDKLAKFYAAQVLLGLEYLHICKLVYRDLKPENIMIDKSGYIKLTDFGFCKRLEKGRTWSFCGTPEYLAPEIIQCKEYGFAVDWWSFGVLMYEMNAGYAPFYSKDPMQLYFKIVKCKYKFPIYFEEDLKHLIDRLLQTDLTKRFGNLKSAAMDIKRHRWFRKVDWMQIYKQSVVPPFVPELDHEADTKYFTDKYDEESMRVNVTDEYKQHFKDF